MLAFIPYRPDLEIDRIPLITVGLCLLCLAVYWQQAATQQRIADAAFEFCKEHRSHAFRRALLSVTESESVNVCRDTLLILHDPVFGEHYMAELLSKAEPLPLYSKEESLEAVNRELDEALRQFRSATARDLTGALSYQAGSWDLSRMVSSAAAHGGWDHVIGNLLGLLAFGVLLEAILGPVLFPVVLLALAVISNTAFSLWHMGADSPQAVIGLSGVVYGTMGLLAYFWPGARVRCLLWLVVIFKRIAVPVSVLAILYIGWDVYDMVEGNDLGVSLISHVSGGVAGYLLGCLLFRRRKQQLATLIEQHS